MPKICGRPVKPSSASTSWMPGKKPRFYSERESGPGLGRSGHARHGGHVPDDIFETARSQFNEQELVDLTLAVVAINGWNRLNIAFRTVPGTYQPGTLAAQLAA